MEKSTVEYGKLGDIVRTDSQNNSDVLVVSVNSRFGVALAGTFSVSTMTCPSLCSFRECPLLVSGDSISDHERAVILPTFFCILRLCLQHIYVCVCLFWWILTF